MLFNSFLVFKITVIMAKDDHKDDEVKGWLWDTNQGEVFKEIKDLDNFFL